MPGISGLEAAALIRRRGSQVPIVFLSVHEEAEFVLAAQRTGALGYVSKVRVASDLIPAIRAALDGRRFVSASVEIGGRRGTCRLNRDFRTNSSCRLGNVCRNGQPAVADIGYTYSMQLRAAKVPSCPHCHSEKLRSTLP